MSLSNLNVIVIELERTKGKRNRGETDQGKRGSSLETEGI